MSQKTKIIIAGIGGVGGYFGGLLAKHYEQSEEVDIVFYARGMNQAAIHNNGLIIRKGNTEINAFPKLVSPRPLVIGEGDVLIISCKSYDLEEMITGLKPCIGKHTIILPLLNGVDSKERIQRIYPENIVLDGCAYIVSRLQSPGVIINMGNVQTLYFGDEGSNEERLSALEKLMTDAGVEAHYSKDIQRVVWEKFIFISPTATVTTAFNKSIGACLNNPPAVETIDGLITEMLKVVERKGIMVANDMREQVWKRLRALPADSTSSMHSDQLRGHRTEMESLTGYVLQEGKRLGLEMPVYERMVGKFDNLKI